MKALTRKQDRAILALLTSSTLSEAAKAAGIGEATLWRWLQLPDFQEAYREARRQAVNQAITRLQQATGEAVETLRNIARDDEAKDSARVTAAKVILEMAFKAVELEDLTARVEELERSAEVKRNAQRSNSKA